MTFITPTEADIDYLALRWLALGRYAWEQLGREFVKSERDLDVLQLLADAYVGDKAPDTLSESLGVGLGRTVIACIPGFDWTVVDDEFGRDIALRFGATSLVANVIGMVVKRFESGEHIDFRALYRFILSQMESFKLTTQQRTPDIGSDA